MKLPSARCRAEPSDTALDYAIRLTQMNPLDENHQALVDPVLRLAGDNKAAERQYASCAEVFERELGVEPGPAVEPRYVRLATTTQTPLMTPRSRPWSRLDRPLSPRAQSQPECIRSGPRPFAVCTRNHRDSRSARGSSWPRRSSIHSVAWTRRVWRRCTKPTRSPSPTSSRGSVAQARAELGYVDFSEAAVRPCGTMAERRSRPWPTTLPPCW